MNDCKCGRIPPCYAGRVFNIYEEAKKVKHEWDMTQELWGAMIDKMRAKLMEGGFFDDTYHKVYGVNEQLCDLGKTILTKNDKDMEEKKTKKMTKAEAFEYLKGKKVKCYERSNALYCELVEKITTKCGGVYSGFMSPPDVSVFAIHIDGAGYIRHLCTVDADKYNELKYEEISADDILSIEIVEKCAKDDEDPYFGGRIKDLQEMIEDDEVLVITKTNFLTMTK